MTLLMKAMKSYIPSFGFINKNISINKRFFSSLNNDINESLISKKSITSSIPNLQLAPEKPKPPQRKVIHEPLLRDEHGNFKMPIYSIISNRNKGMITLYESVFGQKIRKDILQRVIKWQLAKKRKGTNKTKTRSEVSGSTRKPWKQKGLGRARVGDIRPPQWRGGYTCHGPKLRDFSFKLPKKVRAMGLRIALSAKLNEGKLAVVDSLKIQEGKTSALKKILTTKGWDDALFVDGDEVHKNFQLASRNLPCLDSICVRGANVYSILKRDLLILTQEAVETIQKKLDVE